MHPEIGMALSLEPTEFNSPHPLFNPHGALAHRTLMYARTKYAVIAYKTEYGLLTATYHPCVKIIGTHLSLSLRPTATQNI